MFRFSDRRKKVTFALAVQLVLLSLLILPTNSFTAKTYQITIVYTNDVLGEIDPCG
ncbi:MAG: hypothetical protein ABID54_02705 [Pseudomonadota bacterium]